jgi:hypothetical protein|tara:strand:+ start:2010 stop:2234 length:225 start_codon:yes stop_codon:yes gene_type:complete
MRNTNCVILNIDNSQCKNKTKYTADIYGNYTEKDGTRMMPMIDFEICKKHHNIITKQYCFGLKLKNIKKNRKLK